MSDQAVDHLACETAVPRRRGLRPRQLWSDLLARWQHRRLLVRLSRHGPRLLRDLGLSPEEVAAALEGSWDELHPERLRRDDLMP